MAARRVTTASRARDELAARGHTVIYGRNAVREALRGRRKVHRIWATEAAAAEGWSGAPVSVVAADEVERRCGSDAHQGVCAEVDPYPYADAAELLAQPDPLIVALDEVTDPQNLGAVARTAEAVGATGVVIPERRSAEVTAAVCKASAGAVEHLPVARVRNLADFLADAKAAGAWCYGAAAGARTPYRAARLLRRRRARARRRGEGAAPAGRRRLRRPGLAAAARPHRVAQRERHGGGPAVRDLAVPA